MQISGIRNLPLNEVRISCAIERRIIETDRLLMPLEQSMKLPCGTAVAFALKKRSMSTAKDEKKPA
jgi:hypothetical protein